MSYKDRYILCQKTMNTSSNQCLPKQKKVDTFIYIIGHRVVYSFLGKGEVSNKECVL